jgi:hypothetical protein
MKICGSVDARIEISRSRQTVVNGQVAMLSCSLSSFLIVLLADVLVGGVGRLGHSSEITKLLRQFPVDDIPSVPPRFDHTRCSGSPALHKSKI